MVDMGLDGWVGLIDGDNVRSRLRVGHEVECEDEDGVPNLWLRMFADSDDVGTAQFENMRVFELHGRNQIDALRRYCEMILAQNPSVRA